MKPLSRAPSLLLVVLVILSLAPPAAGGVDPVSGIDFVHITDAGNAPWPGNGSSGDRAIGRGSVAYNYHIGRMEVTTAQWVEFFNAAFDRPADDRIPWLIPPNFWGAVPTTPNTPGGLRWTVPAGNENRPVGDISWRMAAVYTNWLHNNKQTNREAFLDGAYDVSTFGTPVGQAGFSDQFTHHPAARYWIPTWDEWLKAAHYDPNRFGPGEGGWWVYSTSSDEPPVGAPPGIGDANFGWRASDFPGQSPFLVPLGAYPDVQSPWGLLDTAGGTSEWTEEIVETSTGFRTRVYEGSRWGSSPGFVIGDTVMWPTGDDFPNVPILNYGLRIASNVPTPSVITGFASFAILASARRQRKRPPPRNRPIPHRPISRIHPSFTPDHLYARGQR